MSSYQTQYSTYQTTKRLNRHAASIIDLDETYIDKHNILSRFNFMSNKSHILKYYIFAIIITIILILILFNITSNPAATLSSINYKYKNEHICGDDNYFKETLKEEYTQSIGGLIQNVPFAPTYESSGVIYDESRDVYWVVFDSLYGIAKLTSQFTRNEDNLLVFPRSTHIIPDYLSNIESGYKGITRDTDTDIFYVLTTAVKFKDHARYDGKVYHPLVRSLMYDDDELYTEMQMCVVGFETASSNDGFASINLIEIDGEKYFVGICEGNYCKSGSKGRKRGHGRVVLFEFEPESLDDGYDGEYDYLKGVGVSCVYPVVDIFTLPHYIEFEDYSAMQFQAKTDNNTDNIFNVVIVSQETAALWIGEAQWSVDDGLDFGVNEDDGNIYYFPKNDECETVFCNVEGVQFINNDQLVMVSDKAKNGGKQSWICGQKDQSVHIFKVP